MGSRFRAVYLTASLVTAAVVGVALIIAGLAGSTGSPRSPSPAELDAMTARAIRTGDPEEIERALRLNRDAVDRAYFAWRDARRRQWAWEKGYRPYLQEVYRQMMEPAP
jgi:hypothetical protein